jgi:hypothetical protein
LHPVLLLPNPLTFESLHDRSGPLPHKAIKIKVLVTLRQPKRVVKQWKPIY